MTLRSLVVGAAGALLVVAVGLAAAAPTPFTDVARPASMKELAFATSLAEALGGEATAVEGRDVGGDVEGRALAGAGVSVRVGGLTVTRIRFATARQAMAYTFRALELSAASPRVVEVRGDQVLMVEGDVSQTARAAALLTSGWAAPYAELRGTSRALAVATLEPGSEHSVLVSDAPFSSLDRSVRRSLDGDARVHMQDERMSWDIAANERASVSVVAPRIDRLRVLRRFLSNLAVLRGEGPLPG